MRSGRWLALGYLAGTAAALVARRRPRRPKWRVEAIRIKHVRRGLVRFEEPSEWAWRAEVDLKGIAAEDFVRLLMS